MKKSKKFILAILIIVIASAFMYLAILQIPKSYLSEKYNLERNEIKTVYFVPPYFRNESNHSIVVQLSRQKSKLFIMN